jgi:hypothetical protein
MIGPTSLITRNCAWTRSGGKVQAKLGLAGRPAAALEV